MLEAKRKSRLLEWSSLLICVLLIAAVSLSGVLNRPKIWPDVQLEYTDGKKAFSVQDGDAYGVIANGPYYDLPVGTYRIKWQMHADGDNEIRLSSSNDARIVPSVIHTTAGKWEDEAYFEILDPTHSFSINLEFTSGTRIEPINFRLYSPEYTDHAWTFAFALLAVWGLFVLVRRGMLTPERKRVMVILGAAVLFSCMPILQDDHLDAYDVQFHAARLMNIVDGLRAGQFPVRVGGFSYNGYGAATSVFYPDVLLYPFALLLLGGASMAYVLNIYTIVVSGLTAAIMYAAAKCLFASSAAGVCASVLYVLNLYRLMDVYRRFMVGEMMAIAVLPLFLLGMYEVIFGEERRWPVLVLGATLIFQSHMVTTLLSACVALGMCVLFCRRLFEQKRRLVALGTACAATLLINMGTLVPFLMYYMTGVNTSVMQFDFVDRALNVSQLFSLNGWMGIACWIALVALVCAETEEGHRKKVTGFALAGIALAMMTTKFFPWSYVSVVTGGLVEIIQFPYRFLTWGMLFLSLAGGYGMHRLFAGKGERAMFLTLMLAVLASAPYLDGVLIEPVGMQFGQGAKTYMVFPEYQIQGTDVSKTRSRQPILTGDVELTQYEKDGTHIEAQVTAQEGGEITFPLFGFDGYAAELNGERVYWWRGENNRLTVDVPAGTQGELCIWFEGITLWRVADVISLLSAVGLLAFALLRRKGEFRPRNRK